MFLVAAFTGLRMGELLALRWRHVDFANRILHVQRSYVAGVEDTPKSPSAAQRPALGPGRRRARRAQPARALHRPRRPCVRHEVGEHGNDDEARDEFYEALDAAGLGHLRATEEPIVFHDLRHTFGTQCAAKVIDLRKIQAWMGHADIQTTMRYLHYVPRTTTRRG